MRRSGEPTFWHCFEEPQGAPNVPKGKTGNAKGEAILDILENWKPAGRAGTPSAHRGSPDLFPISNCL